MWGGCNIPLISGATVALLGLGACDAFLDQIAPSQTAQLIGLVPDQPCTLTDREGRRLAGAYLRQPENALGYDPIFVDGRITKKGLKKNIQFDDTAIRRIRDDDNNVFRGTRKAIAGEIQGFGESGTLPNAYTLSYQTREFDYQGALVIGPSPAETEIPPAGKALFKGRVDLERHLIGDDGTVSFEAATGAFTFEASYGSKRGVLRLSGLDGAWGFTTLTWDNLFLCGARFVSSGQGQVRVSDGETTGYPFQTGPVPLPLRSVLEASSFAPNDRPGAPVALGGVFVIESDAGTLNGVFLSGAPPVTEVEAEG